MNPYPIPPKPLGRPLPWPLPYLSAVRAMNSVNGQFSTDTEAIRNWIVRQHSPRVLRFALWLTRGRGKDLVAQPIAEHARVWDRRLLEAILDEGRAKALFGNRCLPAEQRDELLLYNAEHTMREGHAATPVLNAARRNVFFDRIRTLLSNHGELFTEAGHAKVLAIVQNTAGLHALRNHQGLFWALLADPRTRHEDVVSALDAPGIDYQSLCFLAAEVPGVNDETVALIAQRAIGDETVTWLDEIVPDNSNLPKRLPGIPLTVGQRSRFLPPGIITHRVALQNAGVRAVARLSARAQVHAEALVAEPGETFPAAFRDMARQFPTETIEILDSGKIGDDRFATLVPEDLAPLLHAPDGKTRSGAMLAIGRLGQAQTQTMGFLTGHGAPAGPRTTALARDPASRASMPRRT